MKPILTSTMTSGATMADILQAMETALDRFERDDIIVSCIALSIMLQKPDIEADELQVIAHEVSKLICVMLTGESGEQAN